MTATVSPDELDQLWQATRARARAWLAPPAFSLWIEPLRAVAVRDQTLLLTAAPALRVWVERRYADLLERALDEGGSGLRQIGFVDHSAPPSSAGAKAPRSLPLDPAHSFDRFVIGPANRLAHGAALAVAESPGEAYNPLFIHGPPGLGKTHLLGAIAAYMGQNHPELTVHITTAERFTAEFVGALRRDGPELFKARYRGLDALLIDDVQVLEGKEHTEEEFVHTFNALYGAGKQIVLSSDRPPERLERLAERLRDRFRWGLTVELEPPDMRTRMMLLWRFASVSEPDRPSPRVLAEIAARVPANVRVLEGAMTRVIATSSLLREPVSLPLVERTLAAAPATPPPTAPVTLESIEAAVCSVSSLTSDQLRSSARSAKATHARQLVMYLARELTALSLAEIGRRFGRDHTTVMHAVKAVTSRLEPGSQASTAIHQVRSLLGVETEQSMNASHPSPS